MMQVQDAKVLQGIAGAGCAFMFYLDLYPVPVSGACHQVKLCIRVSILSIDICIPTYNIIHNW